MNSKVNPFQPNSPTPRGAFVGRIPEIEVIERALFQTRSGRSQSFLLLGERGIGKTSLLRLVKFFAQGAIPCRNSTLNYLVIDTDITKETTQSSLIRKIELSMDRELASTEQSRTAFKKIWGFAKRFEVGGVNYKDPEADKEIMFDEFCYAMADTLKRISHTPDSTLFNASYDGVLILIDEADNATVDLQLGAFVKLVTERVQKEGVDKLMFGLAGLPKTKDVLYDSHPSSLRIFEEMKLDQLADHEVRDVIQMALSISAETNKSLTSITPEAEAQLVSYAEGFPHFIQQYGFSAFEASDGNTITLFDVNRGAFGETGALVSIGNKYYRQDFSGKIKSDQYREVLLAMASDFDSWVTKKQIRERVKIKDGVLTNAINALVKRNIIIKKDGVQGVYRLRDKGFAKWMIVQSAAVAANGSGA